ncbi:MAG: phosphoribosylaminoimidazolesuccinocarboxamide synthase, partial [Armatimonadota bacterium]
PRPIFTPSTKAQTGHDQNISRAEAVAIEGEETVAQAEAWTLSLYTEAAAHARKAGLILADTKFEFGHTEEGLIWIDEALSPDSSRYWDEKNYHPGVALPGFDKQYVRNFLERSDWDKTPPGPELPADVVARTRDLYLEAYRRIVGGVPHSLSGP